jgi:hypothetical protein
MKLLLRMLPFSTTFRTSQNDEFSGLCRPSGVRTAKYRRLSLAWGVDRMGEQFREYFYIKDSTDNNSRNLKVSQPSSIMFYSVTIVILCQRNWRRRINLGSFTPLRESTQKRQITLYDEKRQRF